MPGQSQEGMSWGQGQVSSMKTDDWNGHGQAPDTPSLLLLTEFWEPGSWGIGQRWHNEG